MMDSPFEINIQSTGVKNLFSLIDAVLKSPDDAGKRSINLANPKFHERLGQFPAAVKYLTACGVTPEAATNHLQMKTAYTSRY